LSDVFFVYAQVGLLRGSDVTVAGQLPHNVNR